MTCYRPFVRDDLEAVRGLALRQADMTELLDMAHARTVPDALEECLSLSSDTFVVLKDSTICGVFGVSTSKSFAIPWLLGTDEMCTLSFCKQAKQVVREWSLRYPPMYNLVWSENKTSIRFLKWLGFAFPDHAPVPVRGHLYIKFIFPRRT